jgi:hypothetical protein
MLLRNPWLLNDRLPVTGIFFFLTKIKGVFMKHLTTLAVLFVATLVLSFKKPPPATTTTTSEVIPFVQIILVDCANGGLGELVLVEGDLHVVTHVTINGNNVSTKSHFQPQGAKGTGLTTGDTYNAVGVTQDQSKGSLNNGQLETTQINNFRLIGPGPDNNLQVHQNVHTTVNANGDVTSTVDNTSVDCN